MRSQRIAIAVTAINLSALAFFQLNTPTSARSDVAPIIRARAIELVDDNGKTRAQLDIEKTGEVVFRLRDPNGTIRTKLGAGTDGSGLSMMDDRTEATVQIKAEKAGTGITLYDRDGKANPIK